MPLPNDPAKRDDWVRKQTEHLIRVHELPQSKAAYREAGRAAVASGRLARIRELPQTEAGHRDAGRKAVNSGQLDRIRHLPQTLAAQRESGRKRGNEAVISGLLVRIGKLPQTKEGQRRSGAKNVESGHLARIRGLPQSKDAQRRSGRMSAESGRLARIGLLGASASISKRPSWPEARFYGLVLGDPVTTKGFSAQRPDDFGVSDGAWKSERIIAELDGTGHHMFRDRHTEDEGKDVGRRLRGNTVLREDDENVLFLKALAILTARVGVRT